MKFTVTKINLFPLKNLQEVWYFNFNRRSLLYITNRSKDVTLQNRAKFLLDYREMLCSFDGNLYCATRISSQFPLLLVEVQPLIYKTLLNSTSSPLTTVVKYQEVLSDIIQHAQFVSFKNATARSCGDRKAKKIHLKQMDSCG